MFPCSQRHPDGVVQPYDMSDTDDADLVIQMINIHCFGSQRLIAEPDSKTR